MVTIFFRNLSLLIFYNLQVRSNHINFTTTTILFDPIEINKIINELNLNPTYFSEVIERIISTYFSYTCLLQPILRISYTHS